MCNCREIMTDDYIVAIITYFQFYNISNTVYVRNIQNSYSNSQQRGPVYGFFSSPFQDVMYLMCASLYQHAGIQNIILRRDVLFKRLEKRE